MTRIDFYILDDTQAAGGQVFACRLAEKAYQQRHRIHIHTGNAERAEHLDKLLWTFRDGSFLPHRHLADEAEADTATPIHIGHDPESACHDDVLINLDSEVPMIFSRFQRVVEVVCGDAEQKDLARQRFCFYRDRGYHLKSHNITTAKS